MAFFIFLKQHQKKLNTKSSVGEISYQGDLRGLRKRFDVLFNA